MTESDQDQYFGVPILRRIPREIGDQLVLENGIVVSRYDENVMVTGAHAELERELFDEVAREFDGRLFILNDMSKKLTADRDARKVYGSIEGEHYYTAFVVQSMMVEFGISFIMKINANKQKFETFRDHKEAIEWLIAKIDEVS